MTAPHDDTAADHQSIIAQLQAALDAALDREAALTAQLAHKDSAYEERITHQAATNAVLAALSASPGDPQPVFNLIVERARDLCNGYGATVLEFDGTLLFHRASTGIDDDPSVRAAIIAAYPQRPARGRPINRAVLERQLVVVEDLEAEPDLEPALRTLTHKSVVAMPLMRGGVAIGALALGRRERGGFADIQIELLKTFAQQAVIAITSVETYRALQTRTADLQESLEYQTAISDVLKVISRSTFDLQRVLSVVAETAARLCVADQGAVYSYEDDVARLAANFGFPAEYERLMRAAEPIIPVPGHPSVGYRALLECKVIHETDVAAIPTYPEISVKVGKHRTSLGVPLLREGKLIGLVMLARQRVEPFTERQIDLVSTFADQAVIAMGNARLLAEQREALERQTAMAEVLQVINANPGNLTPVFDAILEKAHTLCGATIGSLVVYDGTNCRAAAMKGYSTEYAEVVLQNQAPSARVRRLINGADFVHVLDMKAEEVDSTHAVDRSRSLLTRVC